MNKREKMINTNIENSRKIIQATVLSCATLLLMQACSNKSNFIDIGEQYVAEPQRCYNFNKEDFMETLKKSEDIFVNLVLRDGNVERISFKFTTTEGSFATYNCTSKKPQNYECSGLEDNSKDKIQFNLKEGGMYLHVDHMKMSPSSHTIRSKDKTFSQGIKTPCYLSVETVIAVGNVKKGSRKDKLLKSINLSDLVIYDIDYHQNLAIAVGADNSPKTRELQSQDEHHESVILRSIDSGKTWKRVAWKNDAPHDNVIVIDEKNIVVTASMEGAGGLISRSSDSGKSWKNTYSGGMISSIKQVGKEIVATDIVGTVIRSKDNGKSWTETPKLQKD